jgi:hypothetical protein
MSGKFEIKGPMARLKSDSRFEVRDGKLGVLDFESLTATLKGEGSVIRIEEARVKRESGYFALAGEIDLRRWGRESLFDDLKLASSEAAILWDGIDTSKTQDLKELKVQKKVTEDLNLGFKKFQSDNLINESARESDEVELEYKLQDKESFKVSVGQGSSFFGLEHKDKF